MSNRQRRTDLAVLAVLGGALCGLYLTLGLRVEAARLVGGIDVGVELLFAAVSAAWGLACLWVVRRRPAGRGVLVVVVAVAVLCRLALVAHEPVLSTDVYRYVWDGRVQAAGINPYRHVPQGSTLQGLRDPDLFPFINRRHVPTAYPPTAELLFGALYSGWSDSVVWTKTAMVVLDLLALVLLAALLARVGIDPNRAIVYAWSPLAVLEVGHSGHVEVALVVLVVAALHAALSRRRWLTGALLAAGALVKPYALVLAPALVARASWRAVAAVALGGVATAVALYLPFLSVGARVIGYLPGYLREEGYSGGSGLYLLGGDSGAGTGWAGAAYLAAVATGLVALGIWCWRAPVRESADVPRRALLLMAVALTLLTPRYPWYWLAALALLPFARGAWLAGGAAGLSLPPLLYLHYRTEAEPQWPLAVVHAGMAALLAAGAVAVVLAWLQRRRAAG
jgi:hypothetical protein